MATFSPTDRRNQQCAATGARARPMPPPRRARPCVIALLLAAALMTQNAFAACPPANTTCTVSGAECRITNNYTLDDDCVLDFTAYPTTNTKVIVLTRPAKLIAASGDAFGVKAAQLRIQGTVQAYGATVSLSAIGAAGVPGDVVTETVSNSPGKIDVRNGGTVKIAAVGSVTLNGQDVNADGAVGGDGGRVSVRGAVVSHTSPIHADGKTGGEGGSIDIAAVGTVTVNGLVTANAQGPANGSTPYDGGFVSLSAGGDLTVLKNILVKGDQDGAGGAIELSSGATAVLYGNYNANGVGQEGFADGGRITLQAGSATISGPWTAVGNYGASGGLIEIRTSSGGVTINGQGKLDVSSGGQGGGQAGEVRITAAGALDLGGDIIANAGGDGAYGGLVELDTTTTLTITGTIYARTTTNNGINDGVIHVVRACDVIMNGVLNSRNQVSPAPDSGLNILTYGRSFTGTGSMLGNDAGGNEIRCACLDTAPADGICDPPTACAQAPAVAGIAFTPTPWSLSIRGPMICD